METQDEFEASRSPDAGERPVTLGAILYAGNPKRLVAEAEWVELVRLVAGADQGALHELYARAHRPVFTLAVRITGSRETGEEVAIDVFHDVWRRAWSYDPENGTVLGWIMNQARSRAIDRVRFDQRLKRQDPTQAQRVDDPELADLADPGLILELKQKNGSVRAALAALAPEERDAIEAAFLSELTHVEVAAHLGVPLGTVKTRIRSGLQKLRKTIDSQTNA